MKIIIFYKKSGTVNMRQFEVTVPWQEIASYKVRHVGMSEEDVMDNIAKVYLQTMKGNDYDYMGWQEA